MKEEPAEKPVAESVKLCIELDEEMQKKWAQTKKDLEFHFEYVYKHKQPIRVTDSIMLQCLFYCYMYDDGIPVCFAHTYKENLEAA